MKTSDFYAVAPLSPVNSTAGRVTSKGEHWRPRVGRAVIAHAPLPVMPITNQMRMSGDFADLTGRRVGRLTVIGYGGKSGKNAGGARWVCRCDCGTYTYRYKKTIATPSGAFIGCAECERMNRIREDSVSGVRSSA